MFDIGFSELMLVGVMGLIILGPERLPKAARTVGLLVGRVRRTMSGIQQEIEQEVRNQDIREKLKNPTATYNDSEEQHDKDHDEHHNEDDHDELNAKLKDMSVDEQIAAMHSHHPKEEVEATQPAPSETTPQSSAQQDK